MAKAFAVVEYDEHSVAPPSYDNPITWVDKTHFHSSLLKVTTDIEEMAELKKSRDVTVTPTVSSAFSFMTNRLTRLMLWDDEHQDHLLDWAVDASHSGKPAELEVIREEIEYLLLEYELVETKEQEEIFFERIERYLGQAPILADMMREIYQQYKDDQS